MAVKLGRNIWGLGLHYAWIPLFGALFAAATILSLLMIWLAQGHPKYRYGDAAVVYISYVGADNHALFIVLGTISAILFFASLFCDFLLRHTHRISERQRTFERVASALSIIFGFTCAAGCILLTIFDAFHHSSLHWTFAAIFFISLLLSALFNTIEIAGLKRDYKVDRLIRASFIVKVIIAILGVAFIITMIVLQTTCSEGATTPFKCNKVDSTAAVFEWCVAALFAFYILSICLDLYPSKYTSRHVRRPAGSLESGDVVAAAGAIQMQEVPVPGGLEPKYLNTDRLVPV